MLFYFFIIDFLNLRKLQNLNKTKIFTFDRKLPENIDCSNSDNIHILFKSYLLKTTINLKNFLLNVSPGCRITFSSRSGTNEIISLYGLYYSGYPNNMSDKMYTATPNFNRYCTITIMKDLYEPSFYILSNSEYTISMI